MPVGRPGDQPQDPLDVDLDRGGNRSAARRAACAPASRLWHVAVAAVQPTVLGALAAMAVVVLVLEADRARVRRVILGVAFAASGGQHS